MDHPKSTGSYLDTETGAGSPVHYMFPAKSTNLQRDRLGALDDMTNNLPGIWETHTGYAASPQRVLPTPIQKSTHGRRAHGTRTPYHDHLKHEGHENPSLKTLNDVASMSSHEHAVYFHQRPESVQLSPPSPRNSTPSNKEAERDDTPFFAASLPSPGCEHRLTSQLPDCISSKSGGIFIEPSPTIFSPYTFSRDPDDLVSSSSYDHEFEDTNQDFEALLLLFAGSKLPAPASLDDLVAAISGLEAMDVSRLPETGVFGNITNATPQLASLKLENEAPLERPPASTRMPELQDDTITTPDVTSIADWEGFSPSPHHEVDAFLTIFNLPPITFSPLDFETPAQLSRSLPPLCGNKLQDNVREASPNISISPPAIPPTKPETENVAPTNALDPVTVASTLPFNVLRQSRIPRPKASITSQRVKNKLRAAGLFNFQAASAEDRSSDSDMFWGGSGEGVPLQCGINPSGRRYRIRTPRLPHEPAWFLSPASLDNPILAFGTSREVEIGWRLLNTPTPCYTPPGYRIGTWPRAGDIDPHLSPISHSSLDEMDIALMLDSFTSSPSDLSLAATIPEIFDAADSADGVDEESNEMKLPGAFPVVDCCPLESKLASSWFLALVECLVGW